MASALFAFECRVIYAPFPDWTIVHARTAGRAKQTYLRLVQDPYPAVKYVDIRCRKVGAPRTGAEFLRVARMRGLPDARIGDRIVTRDGQHCGRIVGHNSSANFDILFEPDDPLFPDQVLNVHPYELRILPSEG